MKTILQSVAWVFFCMASDYIGCFCPAGSYSATAHDSQSCQDKATSNTACAAADNAIVSCVMQRCAAECPALAGGGSSSGGSGGAEGGSDAGSTQACGVAFDLASCASCVMSSCCAVTQACANDTACSALLTCITNCNLDTTCETACDASTTTAAQTMISTMTDCWSNSCGPSGC